MKETAHTRGETFDMQSYSGASAMKLECIAVEWHIVLYVFVSPLAQSQHENMRFLSVGRQPMADKDHCACTFALRDNMMRIQDHRSTPAACLMYHVSSVPQTGGGGSMPLKGHTAAEPSDSIHTKAGHRQCQACFQVCIIMLPWPSI